MVSALITVRPTWRMTDVVLQCESACFTSNKMSRLGWFVPAGLIVEGREHISPQILL